MSPPGRSCVSMQDRPFFVDTKIGNLDIVCRFPGPGHQVSDLADKKCKPCEGGVEPLAADAAQALMAQIHDDWSLSDDGTQISRVFEFRAFARTIAFANAVAFIATNEGHHPEMIVNYGNCRVNYTTNAIDGLSDNDFICAAKIDRLAEEL